MSLFLSGALVTEGLRAKYHWMYTFYSVYSVLFSGDSHKTRSVFPSYDSDAVMSHASSETLHLLKLLLVLPHMVV